MADYKVTDTELTGIADAIRAKDGIAEEMEFPSEFESRIAAIPQGSSVQSDWEQTDETADDYIKNKPTIPDELADLADDSTHRLVTDEEKTTWNQKLDEEDLDVGQENADLIAEDLANTLTLNSSYFSGTAKYDKIGNMVIVYVNVTTTASQSTNRRIESGAIPSGSRPSTNTSEVVRSYPSANLRVTTGGYVYLDYNGTTIPSGTVIKGEICYFV